MLLSQDARRAANYKGERTAVNNHEMLTLTCNVISSLQLRVQWRVGVHRNRVQGVGSVNKGGETGLELSYYVYQSCFAADACAVCLALRP